MTHGFPSVLKIAYLTIDDPANLDAWSGINAHMAAALRRCNAIELAHIGPLRTSRALLSKVKARILSFLFRQRYLWTRDPSLLRAYARRAERLLPANCDMVFSPGTEAIAYLRTSKPVVFWTDATFAAMLKYYPWYCGLSRAARRDGLLCDTLALQRSRLAVYSSDWAARSAIDRHGGDAAKIRILPFGANLESALSDDELEGLIPQRQACPWKFLLVGVDWMRKGADTALAVVEELNLRGFPSELIVAGCRPPNGTGRLPRHLRLEGFLDKQTSRGSLRLSELYRSALFYLMPSRAEAYGVVYCEANGFGLPCLATDTGGVRSVIQDGVNGQCFPLEAPIGAYADFILSTLTSGEYPTMARNSLRMSRERLNWNTSIASLMPSLQSIVSSSSG